MAGKNENDATTVATTEVTQDAAPTDQPAVVAVNSPQITLTHFAATNAWTTDARGDRVAAVELMGGFVYRMGLAGRLTDTEERYRAAFESFCKS